MSRKHRWPAKAINLLVALALVISLVAVLAPAAVAQVVEVPPADGFFNPATETCDPTEPREGVVLQVFVNTYTKDAAGEFTRVTQVDVGDCFYVNAVVVNVGNESTTAVDAAAGQAIAATISITGAMALQAGEPSAPAGPSEKFWRVKGLLDDDTQKLRGPGGVADFWWKVCCNSGAAGEPETITVDVTDGFPGTPNTGMGTVQILQYTPPEDNIVQVEIIEAPGLNSPWPTDTVDPSTNFGIKARITNIGTTTLNNVNGTISWTGPATLVGDQNESWFDASPYNNPNNHEWFVGELDPGESTTVAWTLHCDAAGDVKIWVRAEEDAGPGSEGTELHGRTTYINDYYVVHQSTPGGLEVDIITPTADFKQPTGDCGLEVFPVQATVRNTGDVTVPGVYVYFTANNTAVEFELPGLVGPFDILAGQTVPVELDATCVAVGPVTLTVRAAGATAEATATVDIVQHDIIAKIISVTRSAPALGGDPFGDPLTAGPSGYAGQVNVCQEFQVVGSFENYTESALYNLITTINWTGPALMTGGVEFRRIQGGVPGAWQEFEDHETDASFGGAIQANATSGGWYWQDSLDDAICECCETEVRWTFKCSNSTDLKGDVDFWVSMETESGHWDTSVAEKVSVFQEWKAHLVAGLATFLQDDNGVMSQRYAFTPGQDFHVVIPVVNTGNATAEDVTVKYIVSGDNAGEITWSFQEVSGDVESVVTPFAMTGAFIGEGTVNLGDIPGGEMKKLTLRLRCEGEGQVSVWVPDSPLGITAIDGNTGVAVPEDNIDVADCALTVDQVPFTVEIINPITCETFNPGDRFAVKASITNGGSEDMSEVQATIYWESPLGTPYGGAQLVPSQGNTLTKTLGNGSGIGNLGTVINAGTVHEITWELKCTGAGELYIWVSATSAEPYLTAESDDDASLVVLTPGEAAEEWPAANGNQPVNVHQAYSPDIDVEILSPMNDTWIATSEEFAVTARVNSTGGVTADNVTAYLYTNYGRAELIAGESATQVIGDMAVGSEQILTWTLHADTTGTSQCETGEETVYVEVYIDGVYYAEYSKWLTIYPAAHLVAEITSITPGTTIGLGSDFRVNYKVTNVGEADATEVSATLGVTPVGSVMPQEGLGNGFTKQIGTLTGWEADEDPLTQDMATYVGYFDVQCEALGKSTLTITPAGNDECGWFPVDMYNNNKDGERSPIDTSWARNPQAEIRAEFIESASATVKQIPSGALDLAITKTVDDAFPAAEQTVNFTVTVTNNGPTDATGVVVGDGEPTGLTFGTAVASQGTYTAGEWMVGSLVAGGSASLVIPATSDGSEATNTASITAVDQPDPFADNDTASATVNEPAVTSANIALDAGWNLVSLPLIPGDNDIAVVTAGISANLIAVHSYNAATATWTQYDGAGGAFDSLTTMDDGLGYWVQMSATDTLTVSGVVVEAPPATPPTYDVVLGWNLLGFKSTDSRTAGEYLAGIDNGYVRIWEFINGAYSGIVKGDMMNPGQGYWVAVTAAGTIYP